MPLPEMLAVPKPEWCDLRQVIFWIAYDEEPLSPEYERAVRGHVPDLKTRLARHDALLNKAKAALFVQLKQGGLASHGRFSDTCDAPDYSWFCRKYRDHAAKRTPIPQDFWLFEGIDPRLNRATSESGQYIDVMLRCVEMFHVFPPERGPVPDAERPLGSSSYTTPYIELLFRCIGTHGIAADNQPLKDSLVAWFRDQVVDGAPLSENMAKVMASIVRLPEARRGGNRKWR